MRARRSMSRARSSGRFCQRSPSGTASGVIVETEAYIGETDPACHAAPGLTTRNAPLYGPPGVAYVYLNYGIHYLVNAVTEAEGSPAAVLIRALEPQDGEPLMRRRRAKGTGRSPRDFTSAELCRGPGNLTRALGISLRHNLSDLTRSALRIEDRRLQPRDGVMLPAWTPRYSFSGNLPSDRALLSGMAMLSRGWKRRAVG